MPRVRHDLQPEALGRWQCRRCLVRVDADDVASLSPWCSDVDPDADTQPIDVRVDSASRVDRHG